MFNESAGTEQFQQRMILLISCYDKSEINEG